MLNAIASRMQLFHHRDEGACIASFRRNHYAHDVFGVNRQGGIVGRFQLAVFHVVFFHPHEGGISVCLGKAVPLPETVIVVVMPMLPIK